MTSVGTGHFLTIDSLLDTFHESAAAGDLGRYFSCFHPKGTFLGTDVTENWSAPEFLIFCRPIFEPLGMKKGGWTYTPIAGTRKYNFFPTESECSFATFDECVISSDFKVVCRGSGSVTKSADGHWLVFSYHLTFNVPNAIAQQICKDIHKYESASLLRDQTTAADKAAADLLAEFEGVAVSTGHGNKKDKAKRKK